MLKKFATRRLEKHIDMQDRATFVRTGFRNQGVMLPRAGIGAPLSLGDPTGLKNERGKRADWLPYGGDHERDIFAFNGWTGGGSLFGSSSLATRSDSTNLQYQRESLGTRGTSYSKYMILSFLAYPVESRMTIW
jgi:hypothetical protein